MESHSTVGIDNLQMQEHENGLVGAAGQDMLPGTDHFPVIYPLAAHLSLPPAVSPLERGLITMFVHPSRLAESGPDVFASSISRLVD